MQLCFECMCIYFRPLLEDDSSEVPVMPLPSEELEDGDYVVSDEDEEIEAVAEFDDDDEAFAVFH